jgi:tRNA (guanosine-2'-O-)-methyltransferase
MKELITYFSQFITENRFNLMNQVAGMRTRYLTVVLEDIYQPHNASAVLRTCDCLGIQDVHIIENKNRYTLNPDVELGSAQWLDLVKYSGSDDPAMEAIRDLKSKGYRIIATTPHKNDVTPEGFDLTRGPAALVFGTEMRGITPEMISQADEFIKIPMVGFTESFNISVSAAIILHVLTDRLRKSEIDWHLNENERDALLLNWLRKTIKHSDQLEKRYKFENQNLGPCRSNQ